MKKIKDSIYLFIKSTKDIFQYPTMRSEKADYDSYWKDKRGDQIGSLSSWQKNRADFVLKKITENLKDENSISVLDIGCGDGGILNYLKEREAKIKTLIGLDISEFALEKAEKFGIKTYKVNINSIKKEDIPNSNYSLCLEILEHLPNSEEMLSSLFEKSDKGVFFSVPNTGYLTHRLRLLFGKFPLQWRLFPGEHLRYWTLTDMKWWLKSLNFENYEMGCYKGVPILNKIWPELFAAGLIIFVKK
jgi:2-polyprenyl-3-methyl-5-hydroxy-6-metoxy-1,4-benzoquinol methylase